MSQSQEHQQYITFLQRLLGPLLEAYSSAVIFVHNFTGPVTESEYVQKLHRHLISRTEKNVAVYGMFNWFWNWIWFILILLEQNSPNSAAVCLPLFSFLTAESATYSHVKNAVKVFKEIGVSVQWSNLETVKFNFNNQCSFDNSWNLFGVGVKSMNVSVHVLWVLSILLSLRLRALGEEHTLQNRHFLPLRKPLWMRTRQIGIFIHTKLSFSVLFHLLIGHQWQCWKAENIPCA